jgi:hypothetical protein
LLGKVIVQVHRADNNEAMAMTEQEWLARKDPRKILAALPQTASARKLALFAIGRCRRDRGLMKDERSGPNG